MTHLEQRLGGHVVHEANRPVSDRSVETRWADWKATGQQQDARIYAQMTAFGVVVIAGMCAAIWGLFF